MLVILKRDWYAPDGDYYRTGKPVEVPNELEASLPDDAMLLLKDGSKRRPIRTSKQEVEFKGPGKDVSGPNALHAADASRALAESLPKVG